MATNPADCKATQTATRRYSPPASGAKTSAWPVSGSFTSARAGTTYASAIVRKVIFADAVAPGRKAKPRAGVMKAYNVRVAGSSEALTVETEPATVDDDPLIATSARSPVWTALA